MVIRFLTPAQSYLTVGLLMCFLEPPSLPARPLDVSNCHPKGLLCKGGYLLWKDIGRFWAQWLCMLSLAAVYFCVSECTAKTDVIIVLSSMTFCPVQAEYGLAAPGCPAGYTGPGGLARQGAFLGSGCTGEIILAPPCLIPFLYNRVPP